MDNKISTSFIPKQTISSKLKERREPMSIVTSVSILILILSTAYFAGLFGYRYYVYNQIYRACATDGSTGCGLEESFKLVKTNFQYDNLARLKKLDTKLKLGTIVLNNHQTLKPFFDKLSQVTGQNVQFNKFTFDKKGIELAGVASSYEDVAFQAKILDDEINSKDKKITSFSFSDFDLDAKGNVIFKLNLTVDPSLLSFVKNS